VAQKDSKKSVAKKLKSAKKSAAKKVDSKKKQAKSELKKLVMKAEKRVAKSSKSAMAEATALKKPALKKPALKKPAAKKPAAKQPSVGKHGAEVRQAGPVRARRTPATTSAAPSATWSVIALRAHARAAGVAGNSRMKKDELLAHLGVH
jgi:hypothetical protein